MLDLNPDTPVYVRTKHCGGASTKLHTDPDCPRLSVSNFNKKARGQYPEDTPLCQFCSGEYKPHKGDVTGPWQVLETMDPDDLATDGGMGDT